jgi:hypothetical protein
MGKGSKVPPLSRRAREMEGLTALADSSSEDSQAGLDDAPEERGDQQAVPFQAPASLPQRVRGAADSPRPPARVARPKLPESFLERVRAAAAAEAAKLDEESASSDRPANRLPSHEAPATGLPSREAPAIGLPSREAPAIGLPSREAPATGLPSREAPAIGLPSREAPANRLPSREAPAARATSGEVPAAEPPSTGLPQRVRGAGDSPRPPARVARPVMSEALLERVRAAMEANAAADTDTDAEAPNGRPEPAPIPLPRRNRGKGGRPQLPAQVAQPVARPEPRSPRDAVTEPIPVIPVAPDSATADPAVNEVSAPSENSAPAEPEAAEAPAKRQADEAGAQPKAAVASAEVKAAEATVARPQPRPAPSTHARTAPRVQPAGAGTAKPPKRQARASRSYQMAGVLVAAVIVGAAALGFAVLHHTGGNSATGKSAGRSTAGRSGAARSGAGSARPVGPAAISHQAAAWVAAQAGPATISCDPVMCQALKSRGMPDGQLRELKPGTTDPLGSAIIVATPVLRSQVGSRLSSVYAPALLARFGSGSRQIQVRAIAPHGAAAYMSLAKADLAARKMSGTQLAQSSRIVIPAAARRQLAGGEVDSRLMTVLTALAARYPVHIVAFGDSGPVTDVAPFRSADLAGSNLIAMRTLLLAQQSPFRVTQASFLPLHTGQPVLRIDFAAPSMFGLLGSGAGSAG